MNRFTALAACYDRFVGADYSMIVSFIDKTLQKYLEHPLLICDIGCGSGNVTIPLLEKGYDMIGIDGSTEMLNLAYLKKEKVSCGNRALFLCQQLPEFELYGTVDAIISTLDTLNYIKNVKDLRRLFYWFRNYLNPGGLLIFDVNTIYKYQMLLSGHCEIMEDDAAFVAWRSVFNGKRCRHYITVFSNENERYLRQDEEQVQVYYSRRMIEKILFEFGFEILGVYDNYSDKKPDKSSERLTFVARTAK